MKNHNNVSLWVLVGAVALLMATSSARAQENDSIALARQATRCSVVYGMGSAAEKDEARRKRLMNIQRSLMAVAARLGGTRVTMEGWPDEFDKEFMNATSPSEEQGKKMRDETFVPKQADQCESFLRMNREYFQKIMAQ